jgi:GAF domain-containing protein
MAAFAFQNVIQTIDYIRLDSAAAEADRDNVFLLDSALSHKDAQTAVIYRYEPEAFELRGIAIRPAIPMRLSNAGATIASGMSRWIENLARPVQASPAATPMFGKFPEVLQYRLGRVAVIPLRSGDSFLGLLTLGRIEETAYTPGEMERAERVGRLLAAVLERDSLQQKASDIDSLELLESATNRPGPALKMIISNPSLGYGRTEFRNYGDPERKRHYIRIRLNVI